MKKFFCVLGIIAGVATIVMGITILSADIGKSVGTYVKSASFGADFYTYIYDAVKDAAENTAATANNIKALTELVKNGLGYILISLGVLQTCLFGSKLSSSKNEAASEAVYRLKSISEKLENINASLNVPVNMSEPVHEKPRNDELPPM